MLPIVARDVRIIMQQVMILKLISPKIIIHKFNYDLYIYEFINISNLQSYKIAHDSHVRIT